MSGVISSTLRFASIYISVNSFLDSDRTLLQNYLLALEESTPEAKIYYVARIIFNTPLRYIHPFLGKAAILHTAYQLICGREARIPRVWAQEKIKIDHLRITSFPETQRTPEYQSALVPPYDEEGALSLLSQRVSYDELLDLRSIPEELSQDPVLTRYRCALTSRLIRVPVVLYQKSSASANARAICDLQAVWELPPSRREELFDLDLSGTETRYKVDRLTLKHIEDRLYVIRDRLATLQEVQPCSPPASYTILFGETVAPFIHSAADRLDRAVVSILKGRAVAIEESFDRIENLRKVEGDSPLVVMATTVSFVVGMPGVALGLAYGKLVRPLLGLRKERWTTLLQTDKQFFN